MGRRCSPLQSLFLEITHVDRIHASDNRGFGHQAGQVLAGVRAIGHTGTRLTGEKTLVQSEAFAFCQRSSAFPGTRPLNIVTVMEAGISPSQVARKTKTTADQHVRIKAMQLAVHAKGQAQHTVKTKGKFKAINELTGEIPIHAIAAATAGMAAQVG